tara:strand:+ start:2423 stop:2722 length:300 start_codon:yes stop_codon:yes gene_type:complete
MENWEEKQLELEMLDEANRNSYAILTGKRSMDEVEEDFMLVHNPFSIDNTDLSRIMEYFIQTEEYEKCAKIRDIIEARESHIGITNESSETTASKTTAC